jgi:hypothetical protein
LKDELNRLKGEKGKPEIKPNGPKKENDAAKSKEKSPNWKKGSKKPQIKINREEKLEIDKSKLPTDAQFKGYREVTVQNIKLQTDNVKYYLARYYSPSKKKTYEAELPGGVKGSEFGPDLKAFIIELYYNERVTEHKIQKLLCQLGIIISEGQISNILTKENSEIFTKEKEDILEAAMEVCSYIHTDDTGARHKSVNHHVHVLCNELFSYYSIMEKKDRETVKKVLGLKKDETLDKCLITDDAKQFWFIAMLHALCWVHEIRHYKKIDPHIEAHRCKVKKFLEDIHGFYEKLKNYKKNPSKRRKKQLEECFDELFSRKTGYWLLDKRIDLTKEKKDRLLLVLDHPEIPLHNNPAEIALREFVLKRKISYGTRSDLGKVAWENLMTILDTCRKHKVCFFEYIKCVISGITTMKKLAVLIKEKAGLTPT